MTGDKRNKVEQWLIGQRIILKIIALERELDFSRGTISKFYNRKRRLTRIEINIIDKYIQDFIEKYLE